MLKIPEYILKIKKINSCINFLLIINIESELYPFFCISSKEQHNNNTSLINRDSFELNIHVHLVDLFVKM